MSPAPWRTDSGHSLCSAASQHTRFSHPPSPQTVGVTVPGRTDRTPDAPECHLSLLSAGPSQRGMLWFLTPLLRQEASEAVASRALQQAQSKAAPMGTLWHRQPAPCALGTAEPLHALHCAPTSTPGTCAASTLCHTQHCGHPATHPAAHAPCSTHAPWAQALPKHPEGKHLSGIGSNVRVRRQDHGVGHDCSIHAFFIPFPMCPSTWCHQPTPA